MVKPLGSVTMYFPFLDETSCEELNSMMEQTQNFWDFTTLLSEKVTTTTVSEEFVFLASILLIENGRHEFLEKISRRYSGMSSILSLILLSIAYLDESVDYDLAIEGVDRALTQDPPSWIVIHLLEVKVFVGFLKQGWSSEEDKILAQMKEIIESDEQIGESSSS